MFKSLQKSIIPILIILILPTVIFSVYEIGTLHKNEKVIESIYTNQLDAILYSVNQYSEDVLNDWANSISSILNQDKSTVKENLENFFLTTPVVNCLFLYNPETKTLNTFGKDCYKTHFETSLITLVKELVMEQDSVLTKLNTYLRGGYRKIETFILPESNYQTFIFAYKLKDTVQYILVVHSPERFINEVLDPKIQEIAREKFDIAISKTGSDSVVYNSDRKNIPEVVLHKKPLWLIKNYDIGIELKDRTIADLAKSRSSRNLILIGIIDLLLLLSIWFIFRNINKQMELAKLKSDFVSNVSHEIRTPLALIQMYIESLEMGRVRTKEKINEYYNVILQETQRLTGIVNKILSFSQIESGKKQFSFSELHLNDIVETVFKSFTLVLERNNFVTELNLAPDLPIIKGDKEAIADILVNLIDNSMKYSDQEKYIGIKTSWNNTYAIIRITDKGIGIAPKDQKNIFDKFYRVTEKDLALKAKGSGLGLTIVKHIIDAHNGNIEVKSERGAGTEFTLYFPRN